MVSELTARVLVVDDEAGIRDVVSSGLRLVGCEVMAIDRGQTAIDRALSEHFDAIVLDVMLPDVDGFTVCAELRRAGIEVPVLFLTARTESEDAVLGLRRGGDDYVRKPFDLAELVARVEALLRRNRTTAEVKILRFDSIMVDLDAYRATRDGVALDLTPTEFRMLEVLVRNARRVLTRVQLLELVWDDPYERDSSQVDTVISRVRRKLDELGPPVLRTRRGVGYGLLEEN